MKAYNSHDDYPLLGCEPDEDRFNDYNTDMAERDYVERELVRAHRKQTPLRHKRAAWRSRRLSPDYDSLHVHVSSPWRAKAWSKMRVASKNEPEFELPF